MHRGARTHDPKITCCVFFRLSQPGAPGRHHLKREVHETTRPGKKAVVHFPFRWFSVVCVWVTRPSEDSVTWGMLAPASSPPLCWGDVRHRQPFGSGGSSRQGPVLWGPAGDGSRDVLSAPSQPRGTASIERGLLGGLSLDGGSGTFIFVCVPSRNDMKGRVPSFSLCMSLDLLRHKLKNLISSSGQADRNWGYY